MGKKIRYAIALSVFVATLISLPSCSRFSRSKAVSTEFAEFIKAYTGGIVSDKSTVRVRLTSSIPQVSPGTEIKEGIFAFYPPVKGTTRWAAPDMIEFIPAEGALKPGQAYTCRFRLDKVIKVKNRKFHNFVFKFMVAVKEAVLGPGDVIITADSPAMASVEGSLILNDDLSEDKVTEMINLDYPGDSVEFSLTSGDDPRTFHYEIYNLARSDKDRTLKIGLKSGRTTFKTGPGLEVTIPATGDFKVLDATMVEGDSPYLDVVFSEALAPLASEEGFFSLEGVSRSFLQVRDNRVRIYYEGVGEAPLVLTVSESVKSHSGTSLRESFTKSFSSSEPKPGVEIPLQGNILPDSKNLMLPFRAVNLKAVDITVIKIYEDNILTFLQDNGLSDGNSLRRSGRIVCKKQIPLNTDPSRNLHKWQDFAVDLSGLFRREPGAIYRVKLSFVQDYSLYGMASGVDMPSGDGTVDFAPDELTDEDLAVWDVPEPYYWDSNYDWSKYRWEDRNNPLKPTYYMHYEFPVRNLLNTDLGVIAKYSEGDRLWVNVNNILSAKPVFNVDLYVYDYQLKEIGYGRTDPDGMAELDLSGKPFAVVAKKGNYTSYLRVTEGAENSLSRFDIGGKKLEKGLKAYIYGERGVWRPGDTIHLTMILDDRERKIPDTHPATLELYTPQGQFYLKQICGGSKKGFYTFTIPTSNGDPTGSWSAWLKVGGAAFHKSVRIESIKPNRLKVNLDPGANVLEGGKETAMKISSNWLTGPAASGMNASVRMTLSAGSPGFKGFEAYTFNRPFAEFSSSEHELFNGRLDSRGSLSRTVSLPAASDAPGMLRADLVCSVTEPGGDVSYSVTAVPYSPFSSYAGVKLPSSGASGFLETDTDHEFKVAVVDPSGKRLNGKTVEYRIYKLEWSWWWESRSENLDSYVNGTGAELISSGSFVSGASDSTIPFRIDYPDWGRYLLYVRDVESGHISGGVVYVDWPSYRGRSSKTDPSALSMLSFTTDKKSYKVGETAVVYIPSPSGGNALVSLENSRGVISRDWVSAKDGDAVYKFRITGDMAPNFYVHVSLLQPHGKVANDLPIRLYGVQPVSVEDETTTLRPVISMPDAIHPEEPFTVKVKEENGRPMTYTLAIVDEGLLDLTSFKTPDPWSALYSREALGVKTWDLYDNVVGSYSGRFNPMFSIGGDQNIIVNSRKDNRFNPVVEFLGPFTLSSGSGSHTIKLPMYVGSVRVMVVAGQDGAYGNAEKTVPVRSPLMILPSLPAVLGNGERVDMPVNVFVMEGSAGHVNVTVRTEGPLEIVGPASSQVAFSSPGDKLVRFALRARGTGSAKVHVVAEGGGHKAASTIDIEVGEPNPATVSFVTGAIGKGEVWQAGEGLLYPATANWAKLEFSSFPAVDFNGIFSFLAAYQYDCTEQIASRGIGMLSLRPFLDGKNSAQVDILVPKLLKELYSRQLPGGGFTYWPGSSLADSWVSSMAGEFMTMASRNGFDVSRAVVASWSNYQKKSVRDYRNSATPDLSDLDQAYRLYSLAYASDPQDGAMNRLKESQNLSREASWMLSAAYSLTGKKNTAREMIASLKSDARESNAGGRTYSSPVRDKAVAVKALLLVDEVPQALSLSGEIAGYLRPGMYMTQEVAFISSALDILSDKVSSSAFDLVISAGGKDTPVQSAKSVVVEQVDPSLGPVKVRNNADGTVYATLTVENSAGGRPVRARSNGLAISVLYVGLDGKNIDPSSLVQGQEFFSVISVSNTGGVEGYDNLALVEKVPSGWEIFNARLMLGSESPDDVRTDIRDDRTVRYFSLGKGEVRKFVTSLRAAYAGEYVLPSVKCENMYDVRVNACTESGSVRVVASE